MTINSNLLYEATNAVAGATGVVLCAALLAMPLLAAHLYARAYAEPAIESSGDCKEPNARSGSRAENSATIRSG
jgi:hypothetical protein